MKVGSLFSGIGGFDLGLERAGMEVVWQVEIDKFCSRILEKHWPDVKRYGDIRNVGKHNLEPVDLICGGFPCQPFSCAGKRRGKEDDRYLWPEMLRVISEIKPHWIIGENVTGFINMGLDDCIFDLEGEGYEVQPFVIPACAVNAPHRRYRVWIVGRLRYEYRYNPFDHTDANFRKQLQGQENGPVVHIWEARKKLSRCIVDAPDTCREGLQGGKRGKPHEQRQAAHGSITECNHAWDEPWIEVATRFCRVDDGVSNRVDRLKSLGNAVVPQIVEIIGRVIMEIQEANYEN